MGEEPAQCRQRQGWWSFQDGPGRGLDGGHRPVPVRERPRTGGDGLVRLHRGLPGARGSPPGPGLVRAGAEELRSRYRSLPDLRLRRPPVRRAVFQRRTQPDRGHPGHAGAGRPARASPLRQGFQDRPNADQDHRRPGVEGPDAGGEGMVLDQHPREPRRRGPRRP